MAAAVGSAPLAHARTKSGKFGAGVLTSCKFTMGTAGFGKEDVVFGVKGVKAFADIKGCSDRISMRDVKVTLKLYVRGKVDGRHTDQMLAREGSNRGDDDELVVKWNCPRAGRKLSSDDADAREAISTNGYVETYVLVSFGWRDVLVSQQALPWTPFDPKGSYLCGKP